MLWAKVRIIYCMMLCTYAIALAFVICILNHNYTVSLMPSGNVYVCPGEQGFIRCMTTLGPILWISDSGNHLFNSAPKPPGMLGNLTVSVVSAEPDGSNLRVTSNAMISYFQLSGSSLLVVCEETTTKINESATFIPAGECILLFQLLFYFILLLFTCIMYH